VFANSGVAPAGANSPLDPAAAVQPEPVVRSGTPIATASSFGGIGAIIFAGKGDQMRPVGQVASAVVAGPPLRVVSPVIVDSSIRSGTPVANLSIHRGNSFMPQNLYVYLIQASA
jgi:hypothetical protein